MFEILVNIFNTILYRPLFNFLVLLYNYSPGHDFGLAIIVLTLTIRLILYPSSLKSVKSQKALSELQPKLQEIQQKHKEDKTQQTKAIMELYQKEKINPLSGCLPTLVQLPFLIALYQIFWKGIKAEELNNLYGFVANPGQINAYFLGIFNLAQPNIILAVLAGLAQFFQTKMVAPKTARTKGQKSDFSQMMQKQMVYFFPILTVLIFLRLPSAISFYWIVSSIFLIAQQYIIFKKQPIKA